MTAMLYKGIVRSANKGKSLLAILIDPDVFDPVGINSFLRILPRETDFLFVGGSTVDKGVTEKTVQIVKQHTDIPVFIFPGNHHQITEKADGLLFLSLISGRNPEYLIEQQVRAVPKVKNASLEVIPTGYILVDGGKQSAVARVTGTQPMAVTAIDAIVHTALAGQYLGMQLIYLEAGSGASIPVPLSVITAVKKELKIPLVVGGGIKTLSQREAAYAAGADLVVMGTAFENKHGE